MKTGLILAGLWLPLAAQADLSEFNLDLMAVDRVGNGGDAVVCTKGSFSCHEGDCSRPRPAAELLDIYEARDLRKFEIDLGGTELSVAQKLDRVLARLAVVDPWRAGKYRIRI